MSYCYLIYEKGQDYLDPSPQLTSAIRKKKQILEAYDIQRQKVTSESSMKQLLTLLKLLSMKYQDKDTVKHST